MGSEDGEAGMRTANNNITMWPFKGEKKKNKKKKTSQKTNRIHPGDRMLIQTARGADPIIFIGCLIIQLKTDPMYHVITTSKGVSIPQRADVAAGFHSNKAGAPMISCLRTDQCN